MVEFFKLSGLPKRQKIQKVIKILELAEHACANGLKNELLDSFYLKQLFSVVVDDIEEDLKEKIVFWSAEPKENEKRELINRVRHSLYGLAGYAPSEWDLILPLERERQSEIAEFRRRFFKNLFVYAEDIRTPFNIGSLFRTAESFGVEKIFLSMNCVSPENAKAKRVAMGSTEYVPYKHIEFEDLPKLPIIALETGGADINSFSFPKEGIAVVGNEELGITKKVLERADAVLSIPMYGIKASINVSVAFGILMNKWTEKLGGLV